MKVQDRTGEEPWGCREDQRWLEQRRAEACSRPPSTPCSLASLGLEKLGAGPSPYFYILGTCAGAGCVVRGHVTIPLLRPLKRTVESQL